MRALAIIVATSCASTQSPPTTSVTTAPDPTPWRVPDGWKHETIPFPLDFAPALAHRGLEELRFAPGFLDESAANRWSYTFVWRLDDAAMLDAAQLGNELTVYFRGLLAAVDGDKHRLDPAKVAATARPDGDHFALTAHVIDTFRSAGPVDLVGTARRTTCGTGSLWTFVLAPSGSPVRPELDALAAEAHCGQEPAPEPPKPAADAVPDAVSNAPAWIFGYRTADRTETWTLRVAEGKALLEVQSKTGTLRYTGTATEGATLALDVSTGTAKMKLDCKKAKRPLSARCNDTKAKPIDVLDCYHPDFKEPMPFGPAPGVEYVVEARCTGYRLVPPAG
jgi:hypothetical protein